MQPFNLIKGKDYHFTVIDKPPRVVTYRYPTLNCWIFDEESTGKMILLHQQQVIANISEIE